MRQLWLLSRVICLAILFTPACAPKASHSFMELNGRVREGQTLHVTDRLGHKFKGRMENISTIDSVIALRRDETTVRLSEKDVRRIETGDSLKNGLWIGMAVGAGFGVMLAAASCTESPPGSCSENAATAFASVTALGTGIGLGLDAAINRRNLIYESREGLSMIAITVSPFFLRDRTGILVSVAF